MYKWLKKHKFWFFWFPATILWWFASFCIAFIYGNSTRGLAFLLVAPLAIVGLYFASKRTKALESQNKINDNRLLTDKDRLLTETFAKSIELLGSEKEAVRQGAIYALEKIAKTNPGELTVIVNTLCAFIRHNQSILTKEFDNIAIDIEAAVKTIANLSEDFKLDTNTKYDLSNIYLSSADFSRAKLIYFNLSDSCFSDCIFEKVDFSNSNLISSRFNGSYFKDAKFNEYTEIMKTDFSKAKGLTQEMISKAKSDKDTKLPTWK